MNKIFRSLFILFIIISAMITSCKKYENDEALFHLRSPKNRLINKWDFQSAWLQGADISDTMNKIFPSYWIDYKFNETYYIYAFNDSLVSYGMWNFIDYDENFVRYPNSGGVIENKITRLDGNALWYKTWVGDFNDSVEYRFIPKD
jgi:hypothetical protein